MGLKTTNYEVKSLGITVPTAYAIIRDMEIKGSKGKAELVIQASREAASEKQPLEKIYVNFSVNRNENPYVTAYNAAKGEAAEGALQGWVDDII